MVVRRLSIVLAALSVLSLVGAAPGYAKNTPPGSFLQWRVSSASQLSSQVRKMNLVGKRYAGFYNTDRANVASRFSGLRLVRMDRNVRTRIYFVNQRGGVSSKVRTLQKGERVFVTADGTPVLQGDCGNPLSPRLPVATAAQGPSSRRLGNAQVGLNKPAPSPSPAQVPETVASAPEPVVTQVLAAPAEVLAATSLPVAPVAVSAAAVQAGAAAAAAPGVLPAAVAAAGGGSIFGSLAGVGAGLVALAELPNVVDNGGGPEDHVVPEPGSLMALATGLMGLGGCALYRRRRD